MLKNRTHSRKALGCPTGKKRLRDHRAVRSYECSLSRAFHVTSKVETAA